jgi:hypothetical protein
MGAALARFEQVSTLAHAICRALADELVKLGFAPGSVPIADPGSASYRLDRDPASGLDSLVGEWRDTRGQRQGGLVFHADGTFFVEHDVIRPHPRDPRWFVEAVNAWGLGQDIRSEPRLLPVVS